MELYRVASITYLMATGPEEAKLRVEASLTEGWPFEEKPTKVVVPYAFRVRE